MRHFDEHTLEEYVLGNLGADQHAIVTEHLRECAQCHALAEKSREQIEKIKVVLNLARESRPSDCPSNERLALFLDRAIDGAGFEQVENHLAQCSECRVALQAIRHELTLLRSPSETDWAALEQTTISPAHYPVARPSAPSVLRYIDAAAWRYPSVVLMAAILALGGWVPEKFRPHLLLMAVVVALAPVLRDRYLRKVRPISLGLCLMYSVPAVAFLAAWVYPMHSYWCLTLALISGGLLLMPATSASQVESKSAARHSVNGEGCVRKPNVDQISK